MTIVILSLLIFVGSGCVISPFAYNEFTPTYLPPKRRNEFSIVYSRFEWILPEDGEIRIPWEYQIPWYLHPKNSIGGFIKVGLEPKERVEVGTHFGLSTSAGSPTHMSWWSFGVVFSCLSIIKSPSCVSGSPFIHSYLPIVVTILLG